jgi:shikimate kinase
MNLVLIGYRGTGKSVVAARLVEKLPMTVVSLDEEIEREAGLSIPEIVKKHGWSWFRDLESEITKRLSAMDNLILDTGGGVVLRKENVRNLA